MESWTHSLLTNESYTDFKTIQINMSFKQPKGCDSANGDQKKLSVSKYVISSDHWRM